MALGATAVLLWSTVAVGFKLGLAILTPLQLLLLGTSVSWLIFCGTCAISRSWRLDNADRRLVVILGLVNPVSYYLVLFAAYDRLPAHIAQPLNYTWAITLALLAIPVLKQRLSGLAIAGIVISYLGVLIIVGLGDTRVDPLSQVGIALALGSTLLWASYWLLLTRAQSEPGPLMFWSFSVALPVLLLAAWSTDSLPDLTLQNWFYGSWVGVVEMGVTFLLWQRALRLTSSVARIGQLIFFSPFISLLLIHQFLGESISWSAVLGLVLIVTGVIIANRTTPNLTTSQP